MFKFFRYILLIQNQNYEKYLIELVWAPLPRKFKHNFFARGEYFSGGL